MSYKEKPQIRLYKYENSAFVLQAIIDDYQECSFEHNRFNAGQFTISINYNIPNALLFERGLWVQFSSNPYDFGEIQNITDSIGQDGKGSQIRTITGYDSRYIFKRRVIKNLNNNGTWSMTAKGELCMRNLIADQCGSNAETKRQLPIENVIPSSANAIGSEYSVSESFTNLYEVLTTIATQSEIGWRLNFNGTSLSLEFYQGTDRSATVRFDTDYESLANGEFTDSSESYANTVYVGGKGQAGDRDLYEGESLINNSSPSGLDRFESFDNQSSMTTEAEYEAEALSILSQYGQTLQVSGQGLAKCPYEFRSEYEVGDIITIAFSGKSAVVQILAVTEHWGWGSYNLEFSFGKPQPDLSKQLQLMLKQIQKASNKTNSTDSVKWYTIPTDTSMPASDVTYTTIGFIGTCASGGSTFTLYLDNEKTGAKTYHVYFKQLGGGKLTLTTGRAGATSLTMNSGTYVALVYVDEDGNVSTQCSTPTSTIESGNTQPATSSGVQQAISQIAETNVIYDTTITDCNNAFEVGKTNTYWLGNTKANIPNTNHSWYILSQCNPSSVSSNAYVTQIATPADSINYNEVYIRHRYISSYTPTITMAWSSWKPLQNITTETDANKIIPQNNESVVFAPKVMTNNPSDVASMWSITAYISKYTNNNYYATQIAQGYSSTQNYLYARYGVGSAINNIVWGNWNKILIDSDLSKCIQQSNNLVSSSFGYAVDETVPFENFIPKVIQLYGEGWRNIKFFWANAQSFNLSFDNGITFSISGAELFGYFETIHAWRTMSFIFIDSSGGMWRLLCSRTSSETITTEAKRVTLT